MVSFYHVGLGLMRKVCGIKKSVACPYLTDIEITSELCVKPNYSNIGSNERLRCLNLRGWGGYGFMALRTRDWCFHTL